MKRLAYAALGGVLSAFSWSAASACEIVHVYQYQMQDGAYSMALNGVHIAQNDDPSNYFGGGPFMQWLSEGENTFSITMKQGSADIKVQRACQGDFDGDTLVEATVTAPETKELTFTPPAEGEPGEVTVPARKLFDICKSLPEGSDIDFSVKDGKATVKSGRSRLCLGC